MSSVSCAHILIKYDGSRNPKSWRDPQGARIQKTTLETATAQMTAIREKIVKGEANFYDIASEISDCGSAQSQGKLGAFTRGQMQKPFEDASFALGVNQLSDIVVTDSGVHIIYRYA